MRPITFQDLKDLTAYERIRPEFRRQIVDLRSRRRLQAGEKVSIAFENRETVLYQIQEMIRAERIVEPGAIEHELETYNEILPKRGCLAGTLFIEITDAERIREELDAFLGLDRGEHVWFDLGETGRVLGRFAEGQSEENRISSVHYVQFPFSTQAGANFRSVSAPVSLVIEHPNYRARVPVEGVVRRALAEDLTEE